MPTSNDSAHDAAQDTPFARILRWRVHDPREAAAIAATHRARATELRRQVSSDTTEFRDQGRAVALEGRARGCEDLAAACDRHAALLR